MATYGSRNRTTSRRTPGRRGRVGRRTGISSRKYQTGGVTRNGNGSRRHHFHRYGRGTQRHWGRYPGGTTIPPLGYEHIHNWDPMSQDPPSPHFHQFHQKTQQHWGQYPGGQGQGTRGYRHHHGSPTSQNGAMPGRNSVIANNGGASPRNEVMECQEAGGTWDSNHGCTYYAKPASARRRGGRVRRR